MTGPAERRRITATPADADEAAFRRGSFPEPPAPSGTLSPRRPDPRCDLPAQLRGSGAVLAVVAHPEDESFGLGGALSLLAAHGIVVDLLCFTAGEASAVGASAELGAVRA